MMWQSIWTLYFLAWEAGLSIWALATKTLDQVYKAILPSRFDEGSQDNFADRLDSLEAKFNEKEKEIASLKRRLKVAEQSIHELKCNSQTTPSSTHTAEDTKKKAEITVHTKTSSVLSKRTDDVLGSIIRGPPEAYKNESFPRGLVIIFNWNEYGGTTETQNSERFGSKTDVENVIKVFNQIGYVTMLFENLTKRQLLEKLKNLTYFKLLSCVDSFLSFFMSHGSNDEFITSEGESISFQEICSYFDNDQCRVLSGKPKVLFFVYCRRNLQEGEATDNLDGGVILASTTSHPMTKQSDIHIIFSTLNGDVSYRSHITGSLFIQELCQVIRESAHNSTLDEMLNKINKNLLTKPDQQICEHRKLGCTQNLYFNPIVKNGNCQPSITDGRSEAFENKSDLEDSWNCQSNEGTPMEDSELFVEIESLKCKNETLSRDILILETTLRRELLILEMELEEINEEEEEEKGEKEEREKEEEEEIEVEQEEDVEICYYAGCTEDNVKLVEPSDMLNLGI